MATQAKINLKGLADNAKFAKTNDPNYRFVNFFNVNDANSYPIGAINNTSKINFSSTMSIPGNQTEQSCKFNATSLYNKLNNAIDYSALDNYTKGLLECTTISGRMDDGGIINVDYFSGENAVSSNYDLNALTTQQEGPVSIELFGYLVAPISGNYSLNIKPEYANSLNVVLAWIQNSAESAYRTTNTFFNSNDKQNKPIYLAKGVFIPIRIQMITISMISAFPFVITDGINTVSNFYMLKRDRKRKQVVFSLTQNDDKTKSCNIYTEGNVEDYGIDKSMWETGKETSKIEIKEIQRWTLDPTTDSVGLDELGNLVAFSNDIKVGAPIISGAYPLKNPNTTSTYQMILQENASDIIRLKRNNQFPNKTSTTVSTTKQTTSITNIQSNPAWNAFNINTLNSSDRITTTSPLVSARKRFMLTLQKDGTTAAIVLYASVLANTIFYGLDVDTKLGKSFYVNKNAAKQYLREVPSNLLAYSSSSQYNTYNKYYPQQNGAYKIGNTQRCREECNEDPNCTHTYNVTDTTGTKCLLSSDTVIYSPTPSNTQYTNSTLHVKEKMLDLNQMTDKSFSNVKYMQGSITGFNNYTMNLPLTNVSVAGTKGEPEYIKLENQINKSTSNRLPIRKQDPNNKSVSVIQGFSGLFGSNLEGFQYTSLPTRGSGDVVQNISGQLLGLKGQIVDYTGLQTRVSNLARDISSTTININTKYSDMSNNNLRYDFTNNTINALDEDYSLAPALLKDNAVFLEEQNNLNIVGTITLATLLISAIFISR
jgi:hypothetical protein